jgi:phenylacetate-CoA ligase
MMVELRPLYNPRVEQSRYWDEYWQTMPRERLDEVHLRKIQRLIKFAYENTAFYRRLYDRAGLKPEDIKSWEDFYHKVPFTDKPDFMADQEDKPFASQALPTEYILHSFQTSGTTGVPLREIYSRYDEYFADIWCTGWWDMGVRPGDSFYFCFTFGPWIAFWAAYWACRRMNATVYSGAALSTEDRIRHIFVLKPTVVVGTPTYLLHMLQVAKEMGVDLRESSVKYLTGAGEPGLNLAATRQVLAEGWGVEHICDAYGIGEAAFVGIECGAHPGGVHVFEKQHHSYCADPETGERLPDGQVGEHIVTCYHRSGQIFIKYRSHDLVERREHFDHGCGWTWAFLPGTVLGRSDFMITIRGINVYPTAVENLLSQVEGASHHYELHITREEGMDRLGIRLEAKEGIPAENYRQLAQAAREVYRTALGINVEVEVLSPGSLPRYELKSKRFFDHRPPEVRRRLER